jgi:amino acid adenylation domain-containing protein
LAVNDVTLDATALSPEQRELLETILLGGGSDWNTFPLSFAQQRLWFLDRLDPDAPTYNISGVLDMAGLLEVPALRAALGAVVRRHEILRTTFLDVRGDPMQVIAPESFAVLLIADLSGLPKGLREKEAERLSWREARRGFDLATGPLLRSALLRLGERRHFLCLTFHHIVSDGWSSRIFARDLAEIYESALSGVPASLPELPIQYADYSVWQREATAAAEFEAQLRACLGRLMGVPPLDLPTDRPRPFRQRFCGGRLPATLAPSLTSGLSALCDGHGTTLFGGLAAAFQAFLSRLSGQDDFALGAPSANRTRPEVENLIGCFVNTLVLRADVTGSPTFSEFLGRVRREVLDSFLWQEVPFERLVEELEPERDLSRGPLVQVMLALQSTPLDLRLDDLEIRLLEVDNGTAKFDLLLSLVEAPAGLSGYLEYDADLFDSATAARLLRSFGAFLAGAVAEPDGRVGELPVMDEAERWQVLVEWNREAAKRAGGEALIHELFLAQAERTPAAPALIAGEREWTYAGLRAEAVRIAWRLRRLGVGPEVRVGIFLDRGPELIPALLGTLLSGGAYVPLDPAYPEERVRFMLEDCGAAAVLTRRDLAGRLPASAPARLVVDAEESFEALEAPPARAACPGNLAYLIYTSGSTGQPKGVAIEHASAVELLVWARRTFSDSALSGVVAATSISFDLSVFEIFVPLAWGGTVLLVDNALEVARLEGCRARLVNTVPSAVAELLRSGGLPASVETVNLAGEALPGALVRDLYAAGVEQVYNLYGPSEDTTYSTWALVGRGEPHPEIGRPVAGTRAYVLDRGLEPVLLGVPGELYLGGAGLARGYLGRPELTAERFVPDGLWGEPGARLYRTGDLVRHRPDGRLDYLGRLDQQVKVRGFRVELGEVEAVLVGLPGVEECAVLAQGEGVGKRLVAFVAPGPVDPAALQRHVRSRLPEHMVPALVETLGALPLTPNGKVDRRALGRRTVTAPAAGGAGAPRTPVEEMLAGIWTEVLSVEGAGAGDDFFSLGGHSLVAARVVARVRELLGVELPLREIFERPRLAELAERIAELRRPGETAPLPPILPVDRAAGLPLSFAQERLWFLHHLEGGAAYNMPLALRLAGPLDPLLLGRALSEVVRRHETLRTGFPEVDGRPVQIVGPPTPPFLPAVDLKGLGGTAAVAEAGRIAAATASRPFDLAVGPLLRALLLRTGEGEHQFLLVLHHIVADGWSLGILARELEELSGAFAEGLPSPLPDLPVQYADYAAWQRSRLAEERLAERIAVWRERLAGAPEILDLPADRPRPPVRGTRGGRRRELLPAARVEAFARREGVTPFMVFLAGYAAFLSRLSYQEDLVIGAPVAGRNHREIQGLIGCFVNTLALRLDVAEHGPGGTPAFRELVRRARGVMLDAWADQDLPFEKLVEALGLRRSLSHAPLFQTMLVLQSFPLAPPRLPGVETELIQVNTGAARLDLTLALFPTAEGLAAEAEYDADLFDSATAARLLRSFGAFLAGALAEPDRRVGELPVMDEAERWQVLVEWNREAAKRAGGEALIHELFLAQAERTPAAPALIAGEREWTYAGLRAEAVRIAWRLRRLGVGPEVRVGIFLDRGPELIPALLGTLLSGGAYVPLDPAYPEERVRFMLEDCGAAAVLTRRDLAGRLPASAPARLVVDAEESFEALEAPPARAACPGNLAYLIYTSGSTGQPKGVAIEHASAVELLVWARRTFSDSALSGVVAATSISFDLSVFEIFVPLAWGGTVLLVDNALEVARLEGCRARLVNTVPSAVAELLRSGGLPASVETVNLAGEALPGALVRDLYAAGVEQVYNLYGPSEDTTYSTWALVGRGEPHPEIGRPVAGTRAYVLDRGLEPVLLGVPGELYLGGAGLARGYLGRPELTAERFVPDGLWGEPGARLYRTGDLVRHRPDGRLDYLGRLDQQVKVRGFRVELGEVEAVLVGLPGVEECAVLAQGEGVGKRLVAFVAPGPVDPAALQRHVRSRLPEHMVPALVETLGALPLTPNGKVDRRALGRRTVTAPAAGGAGAPRTPVEEMLAGIWTEVLSVEGAGAGDDFFSLGGHSLVAARVVARVRELLGVELPLREIFERPRLAELAERIAELRRPGETAPLPPILPVDRAAGLPLSFAQERLWFLHHLEGGAAYNMPLALRLAGPLDPLLLGRALSEVVRRHETLRTRFALRDGEPRQVIDPASRGLLPLVDLAALPAAIRENEAARLSAEEIRLPLELENGPVFRARLLRLEPAEHRLLFTVHHIAFDGWSMSVLVRELGTLYPAFAAGRPSPLPDLRVQYADYAVWQRGGLAGEALKGHLAYWQRALAGAPTGLDLPLDRPRPAAPRFAGGRLRRVLPGELAGRLEAAGRRRGATLYMTLLAAFGALLSRLSGQDDLVVGSPVAERTRVETEPLIGVLLNTLALRLDLSGEPTFEQLLDRVRETALGAYDHQDLPFERLLPEVRSGRETGGARLFQVFFNMLNFPRAAVELPDLSVDVLSVPELPARFDLTLYARNPTETGGEIVLDLVWNADLLTQVRAAGILDQLVALIEQAAATPGEGIKAYDLVTPAAAAVLPDPRQPLSAAWDGSIVEHARQVAKRDPEKTVVKDAAGNLLTFSALEARSNQIAHALLADDIGPGDVVAVWGHRSAGLVEALLGVWKAGAAFAILDPAYPAPRLVKSLAVAAPAAWLRLAAAPPIPREVQSFLAADCRLGVDLPAPGEAPLAGSPEHDPGVAIGPDDLAYVAFTSGSTGAPKAILGTHAPLSHFMRWHAETFGLGPDDRFSLLSGLAHDPLLRDVFAPLWTGATLLIPDPDELGTPARLLAWMVEERITVVHLTPALAQWIADEDGVVPNGATLPELRRAFFGGDVLTRRDVARLTALAPGVLCVNYYGATETPQAMGFHVMAEAGTAEPGREIVPIGRGIDGAQLLVLGREGRLAGIGELGEIHVRTPYLSLGYRGDEEMTRARFTTNPFTGDPGDRLYQTGDLGRFLPGGEVELAGRADSQVKLRGLRIEPGEVEAALLRHPEVREAVVAARGDVEDSTKRLLAWFVPTGPTAPAAAELQEHLRGLLPAFMVPSLLMPVAAIPLTPNRKVDLRALPEPEPEGSEAGYAAPRDALESALAEIWTDVLGAGRVGLDDDFFALGGHSLMATQVFARTGSVLGITPPVRWIFEAPTVRGLAERIGRALREGAGPEVPPLFPVPRETAPPLSFAQQRLWFLDWLQPGSPWYNIPSALHLEGRLDRTALAWSLAEIVRRHEALRTTFQQTVGELVQVIVPPAGDLLCEVDLGGLPSADREAALAERLAAEARRPFDLACGLLLRTTLFRLDDEKHVLVLVVHHIAFDGWSMGVFARELTALYTAAISGRPSPLSALPCQYADFAVWQREWLQGAVLDHLLDGWRSRLTGAPAALDLPTDRPRPPVQSYRGGLLRFRLERSTLQAARVLSRRAAGSLFMTLLAAGAALFQRLCGQDDMVIGSPVAGRTRRELENLIGVFVNTLPLRVDLTGDPTFGALLARARETALDAYTLQDLPFEKLVDALQPARDLARPPIFQAMLVLQNAPAAVVELSGVTLRLRPVDTATAKMELLFAFTESGGDLAGYLEYNADLLDAATAERLFGHFERLLAGARPDIRLSDLPLLSPAEVAQLVAWNDTETGYPRGRLHDFIAGQVERSPGAVAVVYEGQCLTYRELDRRANRLAHRLIAAGCGPDVPVGILMERSLEMMVGLLATLKAGGAYLPLDPELPRERLGWMAAGVPLVLAQEHLLDRLPGGEARVFPLPPGAPGEPGERADTPVDQAGEESLAYILYTSGSTGRPKGVMISHRGIVNRLFWMQEAYGLTPADRVLQKTPFSFDVSVWELFWPLICGARLVFAQPGGHRDSAYLRDLIEREEITVLHFVPSMLQVFLEERELCRCSCLRRVVCSGEALPPELRERCLERLPAQLENLYGPTEASVDVTRWVCAEARRVVPIGRPIANIRIHLLDRDLRLVPVGVPGELYIAGVGLARGYRDCPDLTAERFLPDPLASEPGERLYRTGDLARYLPDGAIEYLGRIDQQVKINGFRIELGEIEACLMEHPAVREAVVTVHKGNGDPRLVGYVVAAGGPPPDPAALRRFLRERQPEPMVPASLVVLPCLPLSANGKVDRRALPDPEGSVTGSLYAAPRTPLEAALARVWADLLKAPRVGVADNFFDLGGDSIKAVRLVGRANAELGLSLRVQDLFRYPTIEALSSRKAEGGPSVAEELAAGRAQIEALRAALLSDGSQRAKLPPDLEDFYPLSGIEKGMVYYSLLLPDEPIYHDQYVYLLRLPDLDRFYTALALLVGRHVNFRSSFDLQDFDEPMKLVHRVVRPLRDVEDLSGLSTGEQRRRIEAFRTADLERGFDFDRESLLWRLKLFQLAGDLHAAVWSLHHALVDGWSNQSFWVEMSRLVSGELTDPLPQPEAEYRDYVAIALGRKSTARTADYWRDLLAGAGRNKLPYNRAQTWKEGAQGMRIAQRWLRPKLLESLRDRALELHASLQCLCLSAHVILLRVTAGESDVVTGVVTHDRPALQGGDEILGCFLNTVPLRVQTGSLADGLALIRTVSGALTTQKEHQIPLVDIAGLLGVRRDTVGNPIFDTLFNFTDFHLIEEVADNALFAPMTSSELRRSYGFTASEMTNTLFDLEVSATLGKLSARIKYSPRHFHATDIERAVELYERILDRLTREPAAPLDAAGLLTDAEREEILLRFNRTACDYPRQTPVHRFFEEQAARLPGQTAVVCAGQLITYGELDARANRLAHRLCSLGVGPGEAVGLAFERSVDLAIALLAILKAGGAYVPLEPDYPPARKGYILRRSRVRRLLADRPYELELAEGWSTEILLLEAEELAPLSATRPQVVYRPADLAYTIYTSGSTGLPKGVMIEHHAAVNLILWVNRTYGVNAGDRLLMLSSICFDLSVYDLLGGLGAGATVVVAEPEDLQDPARLAALVTGQHITFWNSVPSTMGHLVKYLEEVAPDYRQDELRVVFLSGDWIPLSLPARIRRFFPNVRVISLGGATEATVWSIDYPVEALDPSWVSIPYGRPLANNTFYILDRHLDPVPPGVVGDLYIGGVGVARGYAEDREKTAASFLPDPFAGLPGARLYRTGDLGRWQDEGNIEFLGRADHQVKIRGFRVELGEIESQLAKHSAVRETVVVDRVDRAGDKFLCAYIVAPANPSIADLRAFLARTLPDYMIPNTFVALTELPLTANGKVDRRSLPDPDVENIHGGVGYEPPASALEAALVEIWEEVLGVHGIGRWHDFFELGGHSLSAVQMITRVRRRFGVDLPLREVFETPTVVDVARLLAQHLEEMPEHAAPTEALAACGRRPDHPPLSFAQQRLWLLQRLEPESPAFNMPFALRLRGRLIPSALAASLSEISRRHEVLRTTFAEVDGLPVQRIAPLRQQPLPLVDLRALAAGARDEELAHLADADFHRPFDLERGPLWRTLLLRLDGETHVLLFNIHHTVCDGWSIGILGRELADIYGAFVAGQPSPLPDPAMQFADYAWWEHQHLRGALLEERLAFWREHLAGELPVLQLPMQRSRPAAPRYRGEAVEIRVPPELAEDLRHLAREEGTTLFITMLAAFNTLLHLYTGAEDLIVGTSSANRSTPEVEGLIGLFVNNLALRTKLSGNPSFRQLLRRVREVSLGAFAHQDVPLEKVIQHLETQTRRGGSLANLFQVMLTFQNFPLTPLALPGLILEPMSVESRKASFDLNFILFDLAGSGLAGSVVYDTDLFERAMIEHLVEQFVGLLRQIVHRPDAQVCDFSMIADHETDLMISTFNEDL